MTKRTPRKLAGILFALTALAPIPLLTTPAAAFPAGDAVYTFKYKVVATAFVKRANLTLSPPPGVFKGGIDLTTGKLKGSIILPPTTFTQGYAGVGLITATAATEQTKPVTGTVNIGNFYVKTKSTFNVHIVSMYLSLPPVTITLPGLPGLPPVTITLPELPKVNLVGDNCITSQAIIVKMNGYAHLDGPSTFSGGFVMPNFQDCGVMTDVINNEIPGPGNSFSATATPFPSQ